MRAFKKCLLAGALVAGALTATSSAAHAGQINGAQDGATFIAGATRFDTALDVTCAGSTVALSAGGIPNGAFVPPTPGASPITVPISLAYSGCATSLGGATVYCRGVTLTFDSAGGGSAAGRLRVPTYVATPPASGAGCRIVTATGCEIRFGAMPLVLAATATDGGPGRAVITVGRTGLGFTTSGGFPCLLVNTGTALYESLPANGNVDYTETTGSNVSFA